ncbi:MAG TPA: division/cell wall cluster transcriptional repressor MraZ [Chthonomonadaceae bacterium]|nr:division/cell wall cluster transcriptional repressor MraZ [Chthonomonadaceae bacterium]
MTTTLPRMRGRSEHALDEKGRVILPLKFREALGPEFMLVTSPGPCLRAYPMAVFDRMEDDIRSASVFDEACTDMQAMQRMFYEGDVCSLDQQNRLTIPRALRKHADFGHLDNDAVIIIGMGDKLELWSVTAWAAYKQTLDAQTLNRAAERLRRTGMAQNTAPEAGDGPSPADA